MPVACLITNQSYPAQSVYKLTRFYRQSQGWIRPQNFCLPYVDSRWNSRGCALLLVGIPVRRRLGTLAAALVRGIFLWPYLDEKCQDFRWKSEKEGSSEFYTKILLDNELLSQRKVLVEEVFARQYSHDSIRIFVLVPCVCSCCDRSDRSQIQWSFNFSLNFLTVSNEHESSARYISVDIFPGNFTLQKLISGILDCSTSSILLLSFCHSRLPLIQYCR